MNLYDGQCYFETCDGQYTANFFRTVNYDNEMFVGELLQAAICHDDCIPHFSKHLIGCNECSDPEHSEDWIYCESCDFIPTGEVHKCESCSLGWKIREDERGCERIPIPHCETPSEDNDYCEVCEDKFSWNPESGKCDPCKVNKCLQCE